MAEKKMREIVKIINCVLSFGLIIPSYLLLKLFYKQVVDENTEKIQKYFTSVYMAILIVTTITFIIYALDILYGIKARRKKIILIRNKNVSSNKKFK